MSEKADLLFVLHEGLREAAFEDLKAKHLVLDGTGANEPVHDYLSHPSHTRTGAIESMPRAQESMPKLPPASDQCDVHGQLLEHQLRGSKLDRPG